MRNRPIAVASALAVLPLLTAKASAQCQVDVAPGLGMPGTSGIVYAQHVWDPDGPGPMPAKVVVAGEFRQAGRFGSPLIACVDPATGSWSELPNTEFAGPEIRAMTTLPSGDLVVAGYFGNTGQTVALHIARFDGQNWYPLVTPSGSSIGSDVRALAVLPNGDLVAAGSFQFGGSIQDSSIARWDGLQWSELGRCSGGSTRIRALHVAPSGDLYAGGLFTSVNGVPAANVARWDGNSWQPIGSGASAEVVAITQTTGGELVFAGSFQQFDGVPCGLIVKQQGNTWQALFPAPPAGIAAINSVAALPNGGIVAGGSLGTFDGASVGVWSNGTWTSPPPLTRIGGAPGHVETVGVLPDGSVLVGGMFRDAGATPVSNVARFDPTAPGAGYTSLGSGTNGPVEALLRTRAGVLYAGGSFTMLEGHAITSLARRSASGNWQPVLPAPTGTVTQVLEMRDGTLVVAGAFQEIGGIQARRIARFDGQQWSTFGAGSQIAVDRVAEAPGGQIVATGLFPTGNSFATLARWDGSAWQAFATGESLPNGSVISYPSPAMANLGDGSLLLVARLDNNLSTAVVRWDGQSWTIFAPGLPVIGANLVVLPDGRLLCGGYAWDGTSWTQTGAGDVNAAAERPDGRIWLATDSNNGNGRLLVDNGPNWTVVLETTRRITGLASEPDGTLWFAGAFLDAGGQGSTKLARLQTNCAATVAQAGVGCSSSAGPLEQTATNYAWTGGIARAASTGAPVGSLALDVVGFSGAVQPLAALLPQAGPTCTLWTSPDLLQGPTLTTTGERELALSIPNAAVLVGASFRTQNVVFELTTTGGLSAVSVSNALRWTIGAFE